MTCGALNIRLAMQDKNWNTIINFRRLDLQK